MYKHRSETTKFDNVILNEPDKRAAVAEFHSRARE